MPIVHCDAIGSKNALDFLRERETKKFEICLPKKSASSFIKLKCKAG